MQVRLPQWAQKLMDKHPGTKRPSVENPMPTWLEGELKKMPLWAYIRGTDDVRCGHPYLLIEDVRSQPELMRSVLDLRPELGDLAQRMIDNGIEHLVFTGCGSAFFNSLLAAFLFRQCAHGGDTKKCRALESSPRSFGGEKTFWNSLRGVSGGKSLFGILSAEFGR